MRKIAKERSIETEKEHIRSTRKNIQTTKVKESYPDSCKKSNELYVKTIDSKGKIYTDQTGRFLVQPSKGKNE